MTVSLSLAVMHASFDSERRAMLISLERALGGRVGLDTYTNGWNYIKDGSRDGVWPTARRAWLDYARYDTSHHLVIQDDIVVCKDFLASVRAALEAQPHHPVSFFDLSRTITDAQAKGLSWAVRRSLSMAQAVAIPTKYIQPAIRWIDQHVKPTAEGDDERFSAYFLTHGIDVWYTVPSLVEHVDNGRSLLGHPDKLPTGKRRVAASFIGTNRSGLDIDWRIGLEKPHRGWGHSISEYDRIMIGRLGK
jgi:hypothetical protein